MWDWFEMCVGAVLGFVAGCIISDKIYEMYDQVENNEQEEIAWEEIKPGQHYRRKRYS